MPAIHQFVAGFSRGDAISNEALAMRGIFRSWGCRSEIICDRKRILPELRGEARDLEDASSLCAAGDIGLLHLSIGGRVNDVFPRLPCAKALLYHNITPSAYFRTINPRTAQDLAHGREQARALAGVAAVNLADSRFNARELESLGYARVDVLPLILDMERLRAAPDRRILAQFDDGLLNVLFVGRCAPNKKIEDVLFAFACLQKTVVQNSRLIHVGSCAGTERYHRWLLSMAREMNLGNVVFAGSVPQAELNAFYRCAHVFLCMSEHEGFCIPLVEAMWHKVPIMAYAAAAVPETLDGAGVLFTEKRFELVAEMAERIVRPGALREAVLAGQQERLDRLLRRDLAAELRRHLAPLLGGELLL
jgi:L-malate glycosyltransferase